MRRYQEMATADGTAYADFQVEYPPITYAGYGRLKTKHVPEQNAGANTVCTYNPDDTINTITDARVVYPVGEGKQFTHDGKGVIILGGLYEAGSVHNST